MATLNFMNTVKGSLLEGFYPTGWDYEKIDACCDLGLEGVTQRASFWHPDFVPEPVDNLETMERRMGEEIARVIIEARQASKPLAIILPVGPMGMYKHVVGILRRENISADHVTTFNMDEWSDKHGNTMPGDQAGGFELAMKEAFFEPLGELTVPASQRNFATKDNLPTYAGKIQSIKDAGGTLVTVYGIGRACHIAFWEPQIGDEFDNDTDWRSETHRIGQALHPLTIEQNSLHSFASRFTLLGEHRRSRALSKQRLLYWRCGWGLSNTGRLLARHESVCHITIRSFPLGYFQLDAYPSRKTYFYEGIGWAIGAGGALIKNHRPLSRSELVNYQQGITYSLFLVRDWDLLGGSPG